ncbi:MAG: GDYXXLXY domain-containing protein [Verrucomicrobia bacterium]|nr:GDYXXLXY domain-containing protein [Cytophagales bacterium]
MKKYKWLVIGLNLVLLLIFFNFSVVQKEAILSTGKLVLLELAPLDPRSLMQGDYMALRYGISQGINLDSIPKRGFCVVTLQANSVAEKVRLQTEKTPLNANEYLIAYTSGAWTVNIGAESYFFQEGKAEKYSKAKYGGIRIDKDGNSVLIGLYDEFFKKIN